MERTGTGFVPTSITAAPGLIQLPFTISGFPIAAIRMSASAQMDWGSAVRECTTVTVASSPWHKAHGTTNQTTRGCWAPWLPRVLEVKQQYASSLHRPKRPKAKPSL